MKLKSVGLVALLALVGCDQKSPAGVSVGSKEAFSSTDSAEVTRSKVLEVARTHGMVQRTPLLPLIIRGISSYKMLESEKFAAYLNGWECPLTNNKKDKFYEQMDSLRTLTLSKDASKETLEINKELLAAAEALDKNPAAYNAACARNRIDMIMMPRAGWDSTNEKDMVAFAEQIYLISDGAAEMLAPIMAELSQMNGATEAEIIALAQKRFISAAPEFNRTYMERETSAQLRLMLDKSGKGAPVHYQVINEGADVAIDGYGLLLVKNGVEWLGRGYIKGTSYSIETVSQQAVTMTKGTSMGAGQNSLNQQSTDASGGIK